MIQRIVVIILLILPSVVAKACDGCGCSISQAYFGLTPNTNGHYIGIWWQHQHYKILPDHLFPERGYGSDLFNSVEIRSRFELGNRVQLSAILPVALHQRKRQNGTTPLQGLGDAVLLASYELFDNSDSIQLDWRHRLSAGAGVKLPSGEYRELVDDTESNPAYQTGSGSWDVIFNLAYTLRWRDAGLHIEGTYRHNTANQNDYRFGNRTDVSASIYQLLQAGTTQLMPTLGLHFEHSEWNENKGYFLTDTGGQALLANVGLETYWQQFNLGASYSHPLQQKWNNDWIDAQERFSLHLNYFF